ncbi:MAG TPA: ATP-binding protein [Anaerohalosphaeraceae bacterium]|nr:ATP-binding protein [Anaerohalosphaeraceae bacterium]
MAANPECSPTQLELPGTMEAAERLCGELLQEAVRKGFGEEDLFAIHLALEEAFVNAIQHGNQGDPSKKIHVQYSITPSRFEISIADEGPGFQPDALPDPREPENLYKCSGRGVLLIRSFMDQVQYNSKGNQVRMVKFKSKPGPGKGSNHSTQNVL